MANLKSVLFFLNALLFSNVFSEKHARVIPIVENKDTFAMSCQTGDSEKLTGIIKQYKEGLISFTQAEIIHALNSVITGGHDTILLQLHFLWHINILDLETQRQLVDLALRIGYPNTARLLQQLGCRLTSEQMHSLEHLKQALNSPYTLPAPPAINAQHYEAHGGEDNAALYQREYRLLVAYILYQLRKNPLNFHRLIEDLGHRRRHMAALGKLIGREFFGIATTQYMYTYFSPTYETYGQRVLEKYPNLPKTVFGILNGFSVPLTQIHDAFWQHPNGDHREEILDNVASLCEQALRDTGVDLLHTFGSIIWWLSHSPPFLRGTPTLIYALLDAFCLYHQIPLLCKIPDLNCEALLYDNEEEFALYVIHREVK